MTRGHDSLPQYVSLYASNERRAADAALRVTGAGAAASGTPRNSRRPHGGGDDNTAILKAILPNKEYADEAGAWVQAVSTDGRSFVHFSGAVVPYLIAVVPYLISESSRVNFFKLKVPVSTLVTHDQRVV